VLKGLKNPKKLNNINNVKTKKPCVLALKLHLTLTRERRIMIAVLSGFKNFSFIFFIAILSISTARADKWEKLDSIGSFTLDGSNARFVLESVFNDLEGFLRHFEPVGADIEDIEINARGPKGVPRVTFLAEKLSGLISATVRADFTITKIECKLPALRGGYGIIVNLEESDELLSDQVSDLRIDVCMHEKPENKLLVSTKNYIKKGRNPGLITYPVVKDLIEAQTDSVILAVTKYAKILQSKTKKQLGWAVDTLGELNSVKNQTCSERCEK